jgi:hypothetical protein
MKISCEPDKIKKMLDVTERLMKKANIEIRDTWDGYEGENYDNLRANGYRTDGPKVFDVQLVRDGVPRLVTEPYSLPGHNSLGYEVVKLLIPARRGEDIDPVIHEVAHFLQHNTVESNTAYFNMKSQTVEGYREFVDQRVEQEAHFVQLLYIEEFDEQKIPQEYKDELKGLLKAGLADVNVRTDIIVFAKSIGVI